MVNWNESLILIDESEVTPDGTSKLAGGRPVTEYWCRDNIISGAEGTNKIESYYFFKLLLINIDALFLVFFSSK